MLFFLSMAFDLVELSVAFFGVSHLDFLAMIWGGLM